jgi:hypothetical protein
MTELMLALSVGLLFVIVVVRKCVKSEHKCEPDPEWNDIPGSESLS